MYIVYVSLYAYRFICGWPKVGAIFGEVEIQCWPSYMDANKYKDNFLYRHLYAVDGNLENWTGFCDQLWAINQINYLLKILIRIYTHKTVYTSKCYLLFYNLLCEYSFALYIVPSSSFSTPTFQIPYV